MHHATDCTVKPANKQLLLRVESLTLTVTSSSWNFLLESHCCRVQSWPVLTGRVSRCRRTVRRICTASVTTKLCLRTRQASCQSVGFTTTASSDDSTTWRILRSDTDLACVSVNQRICLRKRNMLRFVTVSISLMSWLFCWSNCMRTTPTYRIQK